MSHIVYGLHLRKFTGLFHVLNCISLFFHYFDYKNFIPFDEIPLPSGVSNPLVTPCPDWSDRVQSRGRGTGDTRWGAELDTFYDFS